MTASRAIVASARFLAILLVAGVVSLTAIAGLVVLVPVWTRSRIQRYCGDAVVGAPMAEVIERAKRSGYVAFMDVEPLGLDAAEPAKATRAAPYSPDAPHSLMVTETFVLAHFVCTVRFDHQKVIGADYSELW